MRQAGASPAQWDVWGASLKEGMYFPLRDAAAGRKKNVITYEQCFSPSLVSAEASPMALCHSSQ